MTSQHNSAISMMAQTLSFSGYQLMTVVTCFLLCNPVSMGTTIVSRHDPDNEVTRDLDHDVMYGLDNDVTSDSDEGFGDTFRDNSEVNLINGILINEMYLCDNDPFVVIFVLSDPQKVKQRTVIRESWASVSRDPQYNTKVIFILGVIQSDVTLSHSDVISSQIRSESDDYHDILQFNILDVYKNLSLKSLAMIQWVNHFCQNVKYFVKVDDDTFINTPLLISDLHNVVHKRFLMGDIIAGARPIRDRKSKYFTPIRYFTGTMYPTYLSGAAYVISGDVIHDLTKAAKRTELFWLEDVYITGLLARRARIKHIFNRKFGFRIQNIATCQLSQIIALHRINSTEMMNAWNLIQNEKVECQH